MKGAITTLVLVGFACSTAQARENCGHDVSGAPRTEQTAVGDQFAVVHYVGPSTLIMDDPRDPRHRMFGECRGQAIVTKGVGVWEGACVYTTQAGDTYYSTWTAKPGDTGTENRDALQGAAVLHASGKFAKFDGRHVKWTGLANGGSYFCME